MTDVHTPPVRRKNMQAIRSRDTAPEVRVRQALFALGLRYRLCVRELPGKPDLVFTRQRAVVFVHGCFWHGHSCHLHKMPATRTEFWASKISANMSRDQRQLAALQASGWRVAVVWECALKGKTKLNFDALIQDLQRWVCSGSTEFAEFTGFAHSAN